MSIGGKKSFRQYMKDAQKERERQETMAEIKAMVRYCQKSKEQYAQKVKEGLRTGDDAAVSFALAMMKNAMFNLKQAEDMSVNMQALFDMEKMQALNRRFVASMDSVSKEIMAQCRGISAGATEKIFDKAVGKQSNVSKQLQELMQKNNLAFRSSVNSLSDIADEEILSTLKAELGKDADSSIDSELEKIEKELNITHVSEDYEQESPRPIAVKEGAPAPVAVADRPNIVTEVSVPPCTAEEGLPVYVEKADEVGHAEECEQRPAEEFTPESLSSFIGQTRIVQRIQAEIRAANALHRPYIDNILLFGNRGLGKSTLMKLIAKELNVEFKYLDCSGLSGDAAGQRRLQRFLMGISCANKPVVIGFDEMHALSDGVQTCLLTLLNDRVYSFIDDKGNPQSIRINAFTFIGATTDSDKVLGTIKDRCHNLTFFLQDYSEDELYRIFSKKFHALGLEPTEEVFSMCTQRCRSSVREVEAFVKGMYTIAINQNTCIVDRDIAELYFSQTEIDCMGLRAKDREILRLLHDEPNGVLSGETLAARAHMDVKVLAADFEPYLLKSGLIQIVTRGRAITEKGNQHIESFLNNPSFGFSGTDGNE